jgi:hypothetical protein
MKRIFSIEDIRVAKHRAIGREYLDQASAALRKAAQFLNPGLGGLGGHQVIEAGLAKIIGDISDLRDEIERAPCDE